MLTNQQSEGNCMRFACLWHLSFICINGLRRYTESEMLCCGHVAATQFYCVKCLSSQLQLWHILYFFK